MTTAIAAGLILLVTALAIAQDEAIAGRSEVVGSAAGPASVGFMDSGITSVFRPEASHVASVDVLVIAGPFVETAPGVLPDSARFFMSLTLVLAAAAIAVRLAHLFVLLRRRRSPNRSGPVGTGRSPPQHPPSRCHGCARPADRSCPSRWSAVTLPSRPRALSLT